jgi:hypothetical protein
MGTDMVYRLDFYDVPNIYGYTGEPNNNPTVYFRTATEHGRITQDHRNGANIGRDVVQSIEGYSIGNAYVVKDPATGNRYIGDPADGNGELRCVEFQEYVNAGGETSERKREAFSTSHTSRNVLVLVSATTNEQARANLISLLSRSIWRFTELKENRRRNSLPPLLKKKNQRRNSLPNLSKPDWD